MKMPYVILYAECMKAMRRMKNETIGEAIRALVDYTDGKQIPELSQSAGVLFDILIDKYERDAQVYERKSRVRSEAAKSRWSKQHSESLQSNANAQNASNPDAFAPTVTKTVTVTVPVQNNSVSPNGEARAKVTRFQPPTLQQVKKYCEERGNSVDAQTFIDFYASKGWRVGNTPMKDWKACVRTWEKRSNGSSSQPHGRERVLQQASYSQREYAENTDIPDWMVDLLQAQQQHKEA